MENDYHNVGTILGEVTSEEVTSETSKMFETSCLSSFWQIFWCILAGTKYSHGYLVKISCLQKIIQKAQIHYA